MDLFSMNTKWGMLCPSCVKNMQRTGIQVDAKWSVCEFCFRASLLLSLEGRIFVHCCLCRNLAQRPAASKLPEHPFVRNANQQDSSDPLASATSRVKYLVNFDISKLQVQAVF